MEVLIGIAAFILGWIGRSLLRPKINQVGDILVQQDEDGIYFSLAISNIADITSKDTVTLGVISHK